MCMPEKNEENNARTNPVNPADDLRKFCENLKDERIEDVKEVLKKYFESQFLSGTPRPWRAITGKKRCRPVPIHRNIWFRESDSEFFYQWPKISREMVHNELKKLGFNVIVYENGNILLTIDPLEKGKKLTFAQEWLKKINHNYSMYCDGEIKYAKELYSTFIELLLSTPKEKIETFEGYTLFHDFKFNGNLSRKCAKHLNKMLEAEGIMQECKNGTYLGIKVLNIEDLTKEEDKND